jgi:hypothetical protein
MEAPEEKIVEEKKNLTIEELANFVKKRICF